MNSKIKDNKTAFLGPILSPIFNPNGLNVFIKRSVQGAKKYKSFGQIFGFPW